MATRTNTARRKPTQKSAVRRADIKDLRRWLRRKSRRARKRVAKKLHLTTTTKKMRPTPTPKQTGTPNGPQLRTLSGKPIPPPKPAAQAPSGGKAAPMSQRVKRKGNGKFNGSTAAAKKTATSKKTVAPNPEQRRLLAANKKAAQIDARLARTEKRIDRMFPDQKGGA